MGRQYLTRQAAATKLNTHFPGENQNMHIKKSELTGHCDESKLTPYNNNNYVPDDDIIKKTDETTLFETTYFNCTFETYTTGAELRAGYYKGDCGSISGLTSTNNWPLDTCYLDLNRSATLVIHREFNILDYTTETLVLKVLFSINRNEQMSNHTFEFTYSWGATGFQGWAPKNSDFYNFYKTNYSACRNITLEYRGTRL